MPTPSATRPDPELVPAFARDAAAGLDHLTRTEWVLANGLGGFAMGTASGIPTRRYHAWLVAATKPPVGRVVTLSACAEWLVPHGSAQRFDLSTFAFHGERQSPAGVGALVRFEKDAACRWFYRIGSVGVVRELVLCRGEGGVRNAAVVRYRVTADRPVSLVVRPLVAMRDFHALRTAGAPAGDVPGSLDVSGSGDLMRVSSSLADVRVRAVGGLFRDEPEVWREFAYARDIDRGQAGVEDLVSPGVFHVEHLRDGVCELRIWADGEEPGGFDAEYDRVCAHISDHGRRTIETLRPAARARRAVGALAAAAQQFVVARESVGVDGHGRAVAAPGLVSVIAGYPWFSDWGRDTMICLPGLLLSTGRLEDARKVLSAFAAMMRRGLIPNCFVDGSGEPEYNTVDAPLWYLHAACRYAEAAGGVDAVRGAVLSACLGIVDAYRAGTDHRIGMDARDGLISAGDETTQLTWMDAKRDGVVFTPRHGKAVEINALWYSGLMSLAALLRDEDANTSAELAAIAEKTGASIRRLFWDPRRSCLFDLLMPGEKAPGFVGESAHPWVPNHQLRPNQIFAVSLPHSALDKPQQEGVVASVRSRLLTPMGLRTLDAADPGFRGRFEGDLMARDGAYHNGTVWPWLIGAYAEAVLRVGGFSEASREEARRAIAPLTAYVDGQSAGQIAEVFDGQFGPGLPQRPDGCMAQAWSVAEVLRITGLIDRS